MDDDLAIGLGFGIPVLLLVIAVVCYIVWRMRKVKYEPKSMKGSAYAFDSPSSKTRTEKEHDSPHAATPRKKKTLFGGTKTDISKLRTEKLETHAGACSTPPVYSTPQEPNGFANSAGPPLPVGFQSTIMA